MRSFGWMFLLLLSARAILAQELPVISFHGQPTLEKGLSVEPFALFYEDPAGDTLQPLGRIERQRFVPAAMMPAIRIRTTRQMPRTSQVIWLQFRVANTHPTDTLRLWYAGGVHAVFSLYEKRNGSLVNLGSGGICAPIVQRLHGHFTLPLNIPPRSTGHYFVRVADYLVLLGDVAGQLHTRESFYRAVVPAVLMEEWLLAAMALILGGLVLMSGYAFIQYLLNGDPAFLYYTLYTAVAGCYIAWMANSRFSLGLAPASLPWLSHPTALSFNHVLGLLYALFMSTLLAIPQRQPRLWRAVRVLMVLLALLQALSVIQLSTGIWIRSNPLYFMIETLPALLMGVLLMVATLRSESKLKPFLLAGQISLYAVALSPLHGFFPLDNLSPQADIFFNYPPFFMSLGLLIELFCFALALAYRSKLIELEKKGLQQQYTQQLETALEVRTREVQQQGQQLERQHIHQLELGFEQQLAEIQMTALRAQMNPHFIFNCLNSIQLYTTSNNAAKASDYLNRFSQLIRLVLENSRSERVTLGNELAALELYLQMEAMRFKDKLRYRIELSPQLDADLIEMPPLLLQPYVENAIWHGLMHKPEGGCLHVRVEQGQEDSLRITITDDGIGRAKAAELKSKSATRHKSFGMKLTGERIALINRLYQTLTQVQIHDLTDAESNPAGTEVVLDIPV